MRTPDLTWDEGFLQPCSSVSYWVQTVSSDTNTKHVEAEICYLYLWWYLREKKLRPALWPDVYHTAELSWLSNISTAPKSQHSVSSPDLNVRYEQLQWAHGTWELLSIKLRRLCLRVLAELHNSWRTLSPLWVHFRGVSDEITPTCSHLELIQSSKNTTEWMEVGFIWFFM